MEEQEFESVDEKQGEFYHLEKTIKQMLLKEDRKKQEE